MDVKLQLDTTSAQLLEPILKVLSEKELLYVLSTVIDSTMFISTCIYH